MFTFRISQFKDKTEKKNSREKRTYTQRAPTYAKRYRSTRRLSRGEKSPKGKDGVLWRHLPSFELFLLERQEKGESNWREQIWKCSVESTLLPEKKKKQKAKQRKNENQQKKKREK